MPATIDIEKIKQNIAARKQLQAEGKLTPDELQQARELHAIRHVDVLRKKFEGYEVLVEPEEGLRVRGTLTDIRYHELVRLGKIQRARAKIWLVTEAGVVHCFEVEGFTRQADGTIKAVLPLTIDRSITPEWFSAG